MSPPLRVRKAWEFLSKNDKQVSIVVDVAGFGLTILAIIISSLSISVQIDANRKQRSQQELLRAESEIEKIYQHKQTINRMILADDEIRERLGGNLEEFDIYNYYLFNDYEKLLALECQGLFNSEQTYRNAQLMIKISTDPATPSGKWFDEKVLMLAKDGKSPYPVGLLRYVMDLRKINLREAREFPLVGPLDSASTVADDHNADSIYTDNNDLNQEILRSGENGKPDLNPDRYCFVTKEDLNELLY